MTSTARTRKDGEAGRMSWEDRYLYAVTKLPPEFWCEGWVYFSQAARRYIPERGRSRREWLWDAAGNGWRTGERHELRQRIRSRKAAQSARDAARHRPNPRPVEFNFPKGLTPKEQDICHMLARGCTKTAIARVLGCSQAWVSKMVVQIREQIVLHREITE